MNRNIVLLLVLMGVNSVAEAQYNMPSIPHAYRVKIGPLGEAGGKMYWVSPKEILENYDDIRQEAKSIERIATEHKAAMVFLTPNPRDAEVQQLRDNDRAYIYSFVDFSNKMLNPGLQITPIGETRAVEEKEVSGKPVRVIERWFYRDGSTKVRKVNTGDRYTWWLPYCPPD